MWMYFIGLCMVLINSLFFIVKGVNIIEQSLNTRFFIAIKYLSEKIRLKKESRIVVGYESSEKSEEYFKLKRMWG